MTAAGGVTYTYDNNGNQTGAGTDTFGWDHENHLTSTSIGGTSGSYAYNGDGLRMSRTIGSTTVSYTWDLSGVLPNIPQDVQGNRYGGERRPMCTGRILTGLRDVGNRTLRSLS